MILFNPITCQKTSIDYETLEGISGISKPNLSCYKSRKLIIKSLMCYILNDDVTYSEIYTLMDKQKIDMEVWKDIDNSTWQISNYGRARYISKDGYKLAIPQLARKRLVYMIRGNNCRETHGVARLVAKYFMDKPTSDKLLLLHRDDNRWNCKAENLEWVSNSYMGKRYGGLSNSIHVVKVDIDTGEYIEEYNSMAEAARENYTCKENIWSSLDNINKSAAGFRWIRGNI